MTLTQALRLAFFLMIPLSTAFAGREPRRPFPQHTRYAEGTLLPSGDRGALDRAVISFYKVWKKLYLRAAGPDRLYIFANPLAAPPSAENPDTIAVSEGQGYGMMIVALMAGADRRARPLFDALYRYADAQPARKDPDLMAWRQRYPGGGDKVSRKDEGDRNAATDGDLDIACALLLADRQWGSDGPINYRREALRRLDAILKAETDPKRRIFLLGNWVDPKGPHGAAFRTSDFMPAHLKQFGRASGDVRWKALTDRLYPIFASLAVLRTPPTGLLPDFAVADPKTPGSYLPAPPQFLESKNDGRYSYNACRVPWRLGTDYLLNGDPRARAVLDPLNAWVRRATGGDPARLNAGYRLRGLPLQPLHRSAAFIGPFAVAAMTDTSPGSQEWLDALWADLVHRAPEEDAYYGNTLKLLSMIVLSGNWWQ
ncbi:MAG TPA: glycosyl hydrolase family 8 [Chthoniobacteraceae bacterium]|nr:glycosyl hydrolase family 8 [Chthoniobacteraceae bacterium]